MTPPGFPRLAHVAVVVGDLTNQTAIPVAALGLVARDWAEVPSESAAVAFLPVGAADVELVQPRSPSGGLARFLAQRGEGLHHIALRVADVNASIAKASAAGLRLAGPAPRAGARGTRIAFVHPASLHGLLLELIEEENQTEDFAS
jgi:methylmalonyl-CoA epimerase